MAIKKLLALLLIVAFAINLCCCAEANDNATSSDEESLDEAASTDYEKFFVETDSDGNGHISFPTDEYNGIPSLDFSGDTLFVTYTVSGLDSAEYTVVSYDIASGIKLSSLSLGEGQWLIKTAAERLYAYDESNGNLRVYSNELQIEHEYTLAQAFEYAVSGNGEYILLLDNEHRLYSVATGEELPALAVGVVTSAVPYLDGFIVESTDGKLYVVDPTTGASSYCGDRRRVRPVAPYLVEEWDDGIIVGSIGDGTRCVISQSDPSEYVVCAADGALATLADGTYRIYDLAKQGYTEVEINAESYGCALYNGYFFVGCANGIYVKDLSKSAFSFCTVNEADENTDIHGWYKPYEGNREDIAAAKRILEKYGVRVIYESDRLKEGVFEYSYIPAESGDVLPVVTVLESFLQTLPDGMISELTDGGEVWFYMCRNITKADDTLGGFASTVIETPLVVVDSECRGETLLSTIAHEFAHIFNYALAASALDKWAEFTPSDYYGEATVQYTPYGTNKNNVWFVSAYARTNEEEDRAETFAAMYTYANYGKLTDIFEYENVFNKAKLYAELLRESFSCCQNAKNLYWEQVFE